MRRGPGSSRCSSACSTRPLARWSGSTPATCLRSCGAATARSTASHTEGWHWAWPQSTTYEASSTVLSPGDVLVLYSDGITEAESPSGVPFDEAGLEAVIAASPDATAPDLAGRVMTAVTAHARDHRFADDLTVMILRRLPPLPNVG